MGSVAKESFVQFRASEEEKAEWAAAAKADDCENVSQWFRKIARDRIRLQKARVKKQED